MSIYFKEKYGKIYEEVDQGEIETFHFENELGKIQNMFIKREIPTKVNNKTYYDLATPYGYGGPIILKAKNQEAKKELVQQYAKEFQKYCRENRIVSEFIRFHPVLENHQDFADVYELNYQRKTIGTNLAAYDDPFQKEFSRSTRHIVRKLLRQGLTYEVIQAPKCLQEFQEIYLESMKRINAADYYYFNNDYFTQLHNELQESIILSNVLHEGKTIATALAFISKNGIIHGHLNGVRTEYSHLSPIYLVNYALVTWGKENGYKLIHAGGGLTKSKKDTLLKFKRRFGRNTEFDYYFGKKIWKPKIYQKLLELTEADPSADYFPAYRTNE